jgi:hypothetical protein
MVCTISQQSTTSNSENNKTMTQADKFDLSQQIAQDLPNFPQDIIETWLLPYAQMLGWPPDTANRGGRWRYILSRNDLNYWQAVRWTMEEMPLNLDDLGPEVLENLNIIAQQISHEDSRKRVMSIADYLKSNGTFPKPIIFIKQNGLLTLSDGSHRLFTYFICQHFIKTHNCENYLRPKHQVWIGLPSDITPS